MPSPSMMDETSQYEVIDFLIDYCKKIKNCPYT